MMNSQSFFDCQDGRPARFYPPVSRSRKAAERKGKWLKAEPQKHRPD
jgi:hypothetical protein